MPRLMRWIIRAVVTLLLGSVALTLLYRFVDPPMTLLMVLRPIQDAVAGGTPVGVHKRWIPIDKVDPDLLRSVIASEDGRFFSHHGIDWEAVHEAQQYNERNAGKRPVRGASTISMQTARNVFLWQGRNWVRKGLEAYFTYLIEFLWGKRRILEVYVNVIEWGDGIYGVEAASQHYFGTSASKLTPRQAALLAVVLPNPREWNPLHPSSFVSSRAGTIVARARSVDLSEIGLGN